MRTRALAAVAASLVGGCASTAAQTADARVGGRVLSAPSCPVERVGVPCPPRPVANGAVVALRGGHVVASTHTDARGYFHLTVAPGQYTVRATNAGGYGSTASRTVTARAGKPVVVRLVVDSGIR
jgi:type IV secretory pathway protease TraF